MTDQKKIISFEEALSGLEKSSEELKKDGTTLEAAIISFEKGIEYYNYCSDILKDAKQKIEVYDKK